jgi:hypothetical protein
MRSPETKRLSSRVMVVFQVFTLFWCTGAVIMSGAAMASTWNKPIRDTLTFGLILLFMFVIGGFFSWRVFRLRRVRAGPSSLFVSSLFKTVDIPYSDVQDVDITRWTYAGPVRVSFKSSNAFGREIYFQPYFIFTFGFDPSHPAVDLLRERVAHAAKSAEIP